MCQNSQIGILTHLLLSLFLWDMARRFQPHRFAYGGMFPCSRFGFCRPMVFAIVKRLYACFHYILQHYILVAAGKYKKKSLKTFKLTYLQY